MKNKLVSYCLFTYNQENYIKEAIEGALKQTYSPLEIIISDDCSSDNTFKIIEETLKNYNGPHKIIVNRNENNLGIGKHFSKIFYELANGDYLITAAGDDISKEHHVEQAIFYAYKFNEVKMVDFSGEIIDENEKVTRQIELEYKYKKNTLNEYLNLKTIELFAPGRIIKKELLDYYEPFFAKCPTEDTVLVLRSLMLGGFVRVNKKLVYYRKHDSNISSINGLSKVSNLAVIAQYMKDILYLFDTNVIDENKSKLLLERVSLEYKIRNLSFGKRNYKIQNITRPLIKRVFKLLFRIKLRINFYG